MLFCANSVFASYLWNINTGINEFYKGNYNYSKTFFTTYLKSNPNDADGYWWLAKSYQKLQDEKNAILNFEKSYAAAFSKNEIEKMDVFITKAGKFFPNDPVENDDMESFLGMVDGKPSKARRIVLKRNGIKQRYYALDKDGNVTHTNPQMAANAIRNLLDDHLTIDEIDLLACGTSSPEQILPSHGSMVHGELGGSHNIEVVSFAGSCCTGVDALKYAYMAVGAGLATNAVASASERLSPWMKASYFQ